MLWKSGPVAILILVPEETQIKDSIKCEVGNKAMLGCLSTLPYGPRLQLASFPSPSNWRQEKGEDREF